MAEQMRFWTKWKLKFTQLAVAVSNKIERLIAFMQQRFSDANNANEADKAFFADSNLATLSGSTRLSHFILWAAAAFIVIGLIWAKFAILDELAIGEGKVVPSSRIQVIQNLEGGIVANILIHEGDWVQKNQILMQLDKTRFLSAYQEALAKKFAFQLKVERLSAEENNTPFLPSAEIKLAIPDLVSSEIALYQSRQSQVQTLQESKRLIEKELALTEPLIKEGAASPVEVIRLKRGVAGIQAQISTFYSDALKDLSETKANLTTLNEEMIALQDRLARTTIRSPVQGIIQQLKINTLGGVVQPGMDLIEIVPINDTLLIEVKVRPADIGFIHVGQTATVKISAYDYSIYGGLAGTVEKISADSITNDKGESFYQVQIRTQKNYLTAGKKRLYIIPGMVASVDILTGKKSVLTYLLTPILKAKERALHER